MLGGILEWIFRYIFGLRFSVDFSPLFGLRRVREMPVSLDFPSSGVDLWTVFGPIFGVLFIIRGFVSLVGLVGFQVCVESQVIFVGRRRWFGTGAMMSCGWVPLVKVGLKQAPKRSKTRNVKKRAKSMLKSKPKQAGTSN